MGVDAMSLGRPGVDLECASNAGKAGIAKVGPFGAAETLQEQGLRQPGMGLGEHRVTAPGFLEDRDSLNEIGPAACPNQGAALEHQFVGVDL